MLKQSKDSPLTFKHYRFQEFLHGIERNSASNQVQGKLAYICIFSHPASFLESLEFWNQAVNDTSLNRKHGINKFKYLRNLAQQRIICRTSFYISFSKVSNDQHYYEVGEQRHLTTSFYISFSKVEFLDKYVTSYKFTKRAIVY